MTAVMELAGTLETWRASRAGGDVDEQTPLIAAKSLEGWFEVVDATPPVSTHRLLSHESGLAPRSWMPWAFQPDLTIHGMGVSSTGLGAIAAGIVLFIATGPTVTATEIIPVRGLFGLVNPGQVLVAPTPLWQEATALRLLTPGLHPRTLRLAERRVAPLEAARTSSIEADARSALTDLMRWLSRSRDDIARTCQFSLRASRYWDTGKTPRPSTVRRLMAVHAFVGALVGELGPDRARLWLEQTAPNGVTRFNELGSEDGLALLLRESSGLLFRSAQPRPAPLPEDAEVAIAAEFADPHQARSLGTSTPRRPRRPPRRT